MQTALRWPLMLLAVLSLSACAASPILPSPAITQTASPTPTVRHVLLLGEVAGTQTAAAPTPTSTYPPTATVPPTPTLPPHVPITVVLAPDVRPTGWSPDGRWIGFWIPYQDTSDPDYFFLDVKPGFYEVATGRTCYHEQFHGTMQVEYAEIGSYWQEDGRAVIVSNGGHIADDPCGDFTPIAYTATPGWGYTLSPDGRYRAETIYQRDPDISTTFISEVKTGEMVDTFTWEHDGGQVGGSGKWVSYQRLLLTGSNRGPLLYTVGGDLIEVMPNLFHVPSARGRGVGGMFDTVTGHFHLLMSSANEQTGMMLYHSETGQTEELPFKYGWSSNGINYGFSPDGHWLLLQRPLGDPCCDYEHEWIRPVDGTDADTVLFAIAGGSASFSPSGGLVAMQDHSQGDNVLILTFPEGEVIQQWSVDGYSIYPLGWSPDGTKLLIHGYLKNIDPFYRDPQGIGLFLADIQP